MSEATRKTRAIGQTLFVLVTVGVLAVLIVMGRRNPAPEPGPEAVSASILPPSHGAGEPKFRVPSPGDPEYADYQEMLAYPRFRASVENAEGYALPYDPEWRSVVTGRREVGPTQLEFTEGTASLKAVGRSLLEAIHTTDINTLNSIRIDKDEFELILWPEFPQSRPYLRIPADEAWMFQNTKQRKGLQHLLTVYGGRELRLDTMNFKERTPYTNFAVYRGVTLKAKDPATGETVEILKDADIAERNGRFKLLSLAG